MLSSNSTSLFLQTLMYVMNQSAIQHDEYSYNFFYTDMGKVMNATKCYGSYGCFPLSPPWTSEYRPISVFPEDLSKIEPNFLFYSRNNPLQPIYIDLNDFDFIGTNGIIPNLPLYVVTHGYLESGDRPWINHITKELLLRENCNIIAIDWHGGSGPPYTQAVANIRLVGAIAAHLLADFARYTNDTKLKHVHAIGHSLGAHLCAYIGYTLQKDFDLKLGRITGMDPAYPHFSNAKPPIRLDRSAAYYVDIIHTDASAFIRGGLGLNERIGHVDYFPNGGTDQPGCDQNFGQYISAESGSFFRGVRKFLGCNHIRSHEYFAESINPKCPFATISCNSYEDFKSGKCFECESNGQHCITFGYHSKAHYDELVRKNILNPHGNLVQYLMTSDRKPFCRVHYRITVHISNSTESKKHGGEVGQLLFTMHSTRNGKGSHSGRVALNDGGYHGPGFKYRAVVPALPVSHLKTIEIEWNYQSSVLNPLTWRIIQSPRIFISKVTVETLEFKQSITVCSKDNKALISNSPQIMMSSYCT